MTAGYTVVLSAQAKQQFDRLIHADRALGVRLSKAIDRLAAHPEAGEFLKGDWKGYRKFRTGRYRIIYRIEHARLVVYVLTIDDRKDVYRLK